MTLTESLVFAGGALVVVATVMSVIGTFIVPRDTPSRVASLLLRVVMEAYRFGSRMFRRYHAKDAFLAFAGPTFLVILLGTWLVLLIGGFGLMTWTLADVGLWSAIREAGSSITTLGFASTPSPGATTIDVVAAMTGLVVIALLIGYLPTLYGAFNRRETLVTLLEARAGAPAWGPEILWRHQRIGIMDSLSELYERWEVWCADLAESHSAYPVLLFFRSPDPLRSWLTGLVAVLDSAALYLALSPSRAPSHARLCLRMGFTSLRTLADTLSIDFDPDPRPDEPVALTYEEYVEGCERLAEIGFPLERSPEEAWPDFVGWRVNYEAVAIALADRIVATPGPWTGRRSVLGELTIPTHRPVDRTPAEPEGTRYTKPD